MVVYSCAGETSRCCKYDQSWFKMLFQLKEDLKNTKIFHFFYVAKAATGSIMMDPVYFPH